MKELESYVKEIVTWFNVNDVPYALIGGIAVAFRAIERATKDVDFALVVKDDKHAEKLVLTISSLGYKVNTLLEQTKQGRIATVRLIKGTAGGVFIDLLFSSTGIESEIVSSAEQLELFDKFYVNVATLPTLLAMKVLSAGDNRPQDVLDIQALLLESTIEEQKIVEELLALISQRGYARKKDLIPEFNKYKNLFLNTA